MTNDNPDQAAPARGPGRRAAAERLPRRAVAPRLHPHGRALPRLAEGEHQQGGGGLHGPDPEFSASDAENVRKVQALMGDEPDGWFGQQQWTRLLTKKPPKQKKPSSGGGGIPVDGMRVTQGFGVKNPRYAAGEHTGVDFGDSGSDDIRCVADGVVAVASFDSDGWGNYVVVKHAGNRYSWYCHLARKQVSVGDRVKRGEGRRPDGRHRQLHRQAPALPGDRWRHGLPGLRQARAALVRPAGTAPHTHRLERGAAVPVPTPSAGHRSSGSTSRSG